MAEFSNLTDDDFETTVKNSQAPVLVDFSATWCQSCKTLAPTLEKVAKEYSGRLHVYEIDVEEAGETAIRLDIVGVPTCVLFKDGREFDRFQGNPDITAIRERVEKMM